jgi:hypothetical protein
MIKNITDNKKLPYIEEKAYNAPTNIYGYARTNNSNNQPKQQNTNQPSTTNPRPNTNQNNQQQD